MAYLVTAPLVVVPDAEGKVTYHYRGALLGHLERDTARHLLDLGMVERVEDRAPTAVVVDDPGGQADDGKGGGGQRTGGTVPRPPATTSPKADWVAYAVSRGMTEAEAESLSRAEIAAKYPEA
ncbi:hypothetical protein [Nocardia farcinica]|uniref:hypothetical protein n=1 Tax=Nocardia farcinica TaxID=37329 RepID=UPI002458A0CA|nr:hypothetical protein [Nocardia farcinica]